MENNSYLSDVFSRNTGDQYETNELKHYKNELHTGEKKSYGSPLMAYPVTATRDDWKDCSVILAKNLDKYRNYAS